MPMYMRFLLNGLPTGGTTAAGRHNNGLEFLGISMGGPMRSSVNTHEIVVTKLMDAATPRLYPLFDPRFAGGITVAASAGAKPREHHYYTVELYNPTVATNKPWPGNGPATLTAEIDFTRTHGGGAETTDLRALLHDVRIVRHDRAMPSDSATPVERIVLRYSRMTHAGLPKSSPDISNLVRVRLG